MAGVARQIDDQLHLLSLGLSRSSKKRLSLPISGTASAASSVSAPSQPFSAKIRKGDRQKDCTESRSNSSCKLLRQTYGIRYRGPKGCRPLTTFDALGKLYPQWISAAISKLHPHMQTPTPVQMQCIPSMLMGHSVIVSAPTGSGKTLAYLIPLLALLKAPTRRLQCRALLLFPTRELSAQVAEEAILLSESRHFKFALLYETTSIPKRYDIALSTPLRLVQLLRDHKLALDSTQILIVDEADRLLDLGFTRQLDEIVAHIPESQRFAIQYGFFSATIQHHIRELIESLTSDPVRISIGAPMCAPQTIDQKLVCVTSDAGKLMIFRQLVNEGQIQPPVLIFVQTIDRAQTLFQELVFDGFLVGVIHSGRPQAERARIMQEFRRQKNIWILICTDLIARGIDFKGVRVVVSWDFPQTAADYVHRIGRTGRAGQQGKAITFYTLEDVPNLRSIAGVIRNSGCSIPDWLADSSKKGFVSSLKPKRPRKSRVLKAKK